MQIYLLRHGETEWSRVGRKQGRGDSPLTPLGERQAIACGDLLASRLDANSAVRISSSPLGRAVRTAELVRARLSSCVESFTTSNLLAEHDYGAWEGLTETEIDRQFPGELARRRQNHWLYRIPNGESYELVSRRISQWLADLEAGSVVVAVAHDIVSRVLRGLYLELPESRIFELTHPHTRIFELAGGEIREHDADAPAA